MARDEEEGGAEQPELLPDACFVSDGRVVCDVYVSAAGPDGG